MNKQIKKLAEQAFFDENTNQPSDKMYTFTEHKMQQFAHMIVAECMRQVEEQYKPVLEDEVMMKDTHWDGYVQCGVDSYVAIREHFYGEKE